MDMKKVISNLKFLGSLKPNDKFNSKFLYVQPDGIVTRLARTFFSYDNRNNALKFIEETINSSFDVLSHYELSNKASDKAMCENIVKDLVMSKVGITSLKMTYNDDIRFCCDIETLVQMLDSKMLDISSKYNLPIEDYIEDIYKKNSQEINTLPRKESDIEIDTETDEKIENNTQHTETKKVSGLLFKKYIEKIEPK
jgi:hypothetical protein